MTAEKVLEKVKEYLKDNKQASSLDIQSDSKHLLFWIENWEEEIKNVSLKNVSPYIIKEECKI